MFSRLRSLHRQTVRRSDREWRLDHDCVFDVLILGPLPPPLGGVAAHLSRLVPVLEGAGLRIGVLNHFHSTDLPCVIGTLKRNPLNYYRLPRKVRARIVHYHHSHWATLLAVVLGQRRGQCYVVTLHNPRIRRQLTSPLPLIGRLTRWALRRFDVIVAVNPDVASIVREKLGGAVIEIIPAFVEPTDDAGKRYDAALEAFLQAGRTLVVAAYRIAFLRGDREVYGLDTAVAAFQALAPEDPALRLAIFVAKRPSGRKARQYVARLEAQLEEVGLRDRAVISFELPLLPAFRHDVLYLRPSRSDGDAVSIREALHAGVPVVASDVVERPAGVTLFPSEDVQQLRSAIQRLLYRTRAGVARAGAESTNPSLGSSFSERLLDLYVSHLGPDVRRSPAE